MTRYQYLKGKRVHEAEQLSWSNLEEKKTFYQGFEQNSSKESLSNGQYRSLEGLTRPSLTEQATHSLNQSSQIGLYE